VAALGGVDAYEALRRGAGALGVGLGDAAEEFGVLGLETVGRARYSAPMPEEAAPWRS